MAHVEFTIEPFVEGQPGPHVTAAIDAARQLGFQVDVGPFGSSCTVESADAGAVVAAVTDAAIAKGATHVNVHVSPHAPQGPPAFEMPRSAGS